MFSKGDNPFFDNNGRNNIAHNYNKARDLVMSNGYDALMTVEADMVIPTNALSKMIKHDADVVYGLYCFIALPFIGFCPNQLWYGLYPLGHLLFPPGML